MALMVQRRAEGVQAHPGVRGAPAAARRGGLWGQLLHKQEAPVFARQTPQRRGTECGWDGPARPFCPGPRSIPHPPPPPRPRQRRAAAARAARPTRNGGAYPTWPSACRPGVAGAAAGSGLSSLPGPRPCTARRPGDSHGLPRGRCRRARTQQLVQLCLISKRVLNHGEGAGGCRQSRGPAA